MIKPQLPMTRRQSGVTLLELLVVLMILSVILTAAVKTWDVTLERGRAETTTRKLNQLVSVIAGDPNYVVAGHRADFGFIGDMGRLPFNLTELAVGPVVTPPESSVWRGPYIRSTFSESPDGYRIDGWGDTIAYVRETLFVRSYGGRGQAEPNRWQTVYFPFSDSGDLTANTLDGQIVDVRGRQIPAESLRFNIFVTLYRPGPSGKLVPDLKTGLQLNPDGSFTYSPVAQGTYRLFVKYLQFTPSYDSAQTQLDVVVYPRIGAHVTARLNWDWDRSQ